VGIRRDIITSAIAIVFFTLLLGILYPLLVTGIGQGVFPGNANGQQVKVNGTLVGSKLIGQNFGTPVIEKGKPKEVKGAIVTEPDKIYFQTRPSATEGGADNAAASAFSNRGPNSVRTKEADEETIKSYLELEKPYDPGLTVAQIPVDAINTSASGIDPEISVANAHIQAHRVAAVRGLSLSQVDSLVTRYTHERGLGFSGEPGVNVLELNLALDRLQGKAG
jgi:potassium-transporting ATPase KdpC subunit